jgi:hypothetical protein
MVENFIKGMIAVFSNKFMKENTKRALNVCKQQDSTIGEYNSHLCSLVYLVEDVEAARIEQYVSGLNPQIVWKAMSKEWRATDTLEARMELAIKAAAQLDLLALLPPDSAQPVCHKPLSSAPPLGLPFQPHHPAPPAAAHDPNAMEINAATIRPGNCFPTVLDVSHSLCRSKGLCFQCLQPIVPVTHTGSLKCLNTPITLEQRAAFVKRHKASLAALVLAIQSVPHPPSVPQPPSSSPLTYQPTKDPTKETQDLDPLAEEELVMGNYHNYNEEYNNYDEPVCSAINVAINIVQVRLDCSKSGHLIVPAWFKASNGNEVPANILVDMGAMANFVSEEFVRRHNFKLCQCRTLICCVGFDGREGVGGLVTQDLVNIVHLLTIDSRPVPLPSSFGVTWLGSINAIFGLPWLDKQGWVALGSLKGGHQFTLGSTPLYMMETLLQGRKPEGNVLPPVHSPSPPLTIPPEFEQFADVFSPQLNVTLPPHRSMDISINLVSLCDAKG